MRILEQNDPTSFSCKWVLFSDSLFTVRRLMVQVSLSLLQLSIYGIIIIVAEMLEGPRKTLYRTSPLQKRGL